MKTKRSVFNNKKYKSTFYECAYCYYPDRNYILDYKMCNCDHFPGYIPVEQKKRYLIMKLKRLNKEKVKDALKFVDIKLFNKCLKEDSNEM